MSQVPPLIPPGWIPAYLISLFAVLIYISASTVRGSDHFFYQYYIDCIRLNGHRFISFFPNFVNRTRVMDPQLIYALLSFLPKRYCNLYAIAFNPLVTLLTLVCLYFGALQLTGSNEISSTVTVLSSLVPQYFYVRNSRLSGLSGRGIGILLFLLLNLVHLHSIIYNVSWWTHLTVSSVVCLLIILSNIFALQGVCFIGFILALLFRDFLCSSPCLSVSFCFF